MNRTENWVRDEHGRLRRETVHSMLRRLPGWDYRGRAIYQITITLADRSAGLLGRLEVKGPGGWVSVDEAKILGLNPEEIEARVVASDLGREVERCWAEIADQWPGVRPLKLQLMPEHLHGILFVERPQPKTLGNIVGSFKSKSASRAKGYLAARGQGQNPARGQERNPARGQEQNPARGRELGEAARALSDGAFSSPPRAAGLWAPGFQDTILFHAGQLDNMFRYLADNPRRRAIKALFPELFRVVSELALPLVTGGADAPCEIGRFSALGNRFLLERPLAQVQVSRDDLAYRREPKPGGGLKIARDATGAPDAWPYRPGEKRMTRVDATAMNRLCQWLVGEDAAEINYHGMKLSNIDALARAAAKVN